MTAQLSILPDTLVEAERFKDSVFITLKLQTPSSFKKQVRNQDALLAYFSQREAEIAAKRAAGDTEWTETPAISLPAGSVKAGGKSKKAVTATKTLLFSPALDALREHMNAVKQQIVAPPQYGGLANPTGIMEGLFEVSKALVPKVKEIIAEGNRRLLEDWVNEKNEIKPGHLAHFLADYEAAIERARTAPILEGGLGPLFDATDYPTANEIRNGFGIHRRLISLTVPEGLSPEDKAEAQEELRADLRNAAETIKDSLAQGLSELLNHAKEVLEVKPGEKPKIVKESLIGNVLQFCETFQFRNTQGDAQLATLVEEAKAALTGVDPEKVRRFAHVRADAAARFTELSAKIDDLITTRKTRHFDLTPD